VTTQPIGGSLQNPPACKHIKTFNLVEWLKNLQLQWAAGVAAPKPIGQVSRHTPISPNQPDVPKTVAYPVEQQFSTILVLNVGRMNDHRKNQTQRVYQQVAFAAVDFFGRKYRLDTGCGWSLWFQCLLTDTDQHHILGFQFEG
jgi:hypothetical protein